ncbi:MAG: hypothetical protein E6H75_05995 [Betaproteobacteria bacterium]|nr:MAG: hypothetical protein E6H80_09005 [Betaproteobacteria bacterium]TMG77594.1 MAG: hypothetical protein E6H75_05995 [Betaproteobacteria bacterium]
MLKKMSVFALFLGIVCPLSAGAQDSLAKFKGGIGAIPVSNVVVAADGTVTVSRNVVRGVNSPGQIWVIADLRADVKADGLGSITVKGKGLVLGGGNSAGRTTGQNVFATLICEAAAPFTERSTDAAGVPLALNGDFRIDDVLSPAPVDCPSPMLLIRNAAGRVWFAVGIPNFGDDD